MPESSLSNLGILASVPPPPGEYEGTHGYPRPQLRRDAWTNLNGPWEFALDPDAEYLRPEDVQFRQTIEVPFSPETARSGIADTGLYQACWYRKTIEIPEFSDRERVILHFGAVDYEATVYVDGVYMCRHEGGYNPFDIDLSERVHGQREATIVVRAFDDPSDLGKPRGKQDWQLEAHSIWYPRTTGIWQTVWLEKVPATRLERLRWTPSLERWELGIEAMVVSDVPQKLRLRMRLRAGRVVLADDVYTVVAGEVHRRIALSDPGIDDFRNVLLWSPEAPNLLLVELSLLDEEGTVIDHVHSYTALRSVAVQGDRFVLNGRPFPLRLVLDQGYWPESGLTPPDDDALRRDIELTKRMGFNGARKHQKIEDPRYLYWADRLGLLVWEEMPSAYRFTRRSIQRVTSQWTEAILRDYSHPCIVAWVPFNESWGVPNLPDNAPERHYVQGIYHLTKSLDPTRPVIGNDGWESTATDIIGIHDYDPFPERIARRYFAHDAVPKLFQRERPGGRLLVLDGHSAADVPLVLSEFGGIAMGPQEHGNWGYSRCRTPEEFGRRYGALLEVVGSLEVLAGFCYTQFADTYQEANGLLYADRTPKVPLELVYRATRGQAELHAPPEVAQAEKGPEGGAP